MANLLKYLPREVLEQGDERFIYNVFNPLLFDKAYVTPEAYREEITFVATSEQKKIPNGVDFETFNIYDVNTNKKVPLITNFDAYEKLNTYKENINSILQSNQTLQALTYKITKPQFEIYGLRDKIHTLSEQIKNEDNQSRKQILTISLSELEHDLKFKTAIKEEIDKIIATLSSAKFDFEKIQHDLTLFFTKRYSMRTTSFRISFMGSALSSYLGEECSIFIDLLETASKTIYELYTGYTTYLTMLADYNGIGVSVTKSDTMNLQNVKFEDVILTNTSKSLEISIGDKEIELFIYLKMDVDIDEDTLKIYIGEELIAPAITENNDNGYSIMSYFNNTVKFYKIKIPNRFTNVSDNDIKVVFSSTETKQFISEYKYEGYIRTNRFFDNFKLYGKRSEQLFYEELKLPISVKIGIDEYEEYFLRSYTILPNIADSKNFMNQFEEIVVVCNEFDYDLYLEAHYNFLETSELKLSLSYKILQQYVLLEDIKDKDLTLDYYVLATDDNLVNKDALKEMVDGNLYIKQFRKVYDRSILLNNGELGDTYLEKIDYSEYSKFVDINDLSRIKELFPFLKHFSSASKINVDKNMNIITFSDGIYSYAYDLNSYNPFGIVIINPISQTINGELFNESNIFIHKSGVDITVGNQTYKLSDNKIIPINSKIDKLYFDTNAQGMCFVYENVKYIVTESPELRLDTNSGLMYFGTDFKNVLSYDKYSLENINLDTETATVRINEENSILIKFSVTSYIKKSKNSGITINSFFYSGNAVPEYSNRNVFARQNIIDSANFVEKIFEIGHSADNYATDQKELLASQFDIDLSRNSDFEMEEDPFIMFGSNNKSFKGLKSYLKNNLKFISKDIDINSVFLVQRNRFLSEWAKVSNNSTINALTKDALKALTNDLFERRKISSNLDNLIKVYQGEFNKEFSMLTNNIDEVIQNYILRYIEKEKLWNELNYYLVHKIWITNNISSIRSWLINSTNLTSEEREQLSSAELTTSILEYIKQLFVAKKMILGQVTEIASFKPLESFSDYQDFLANNDIYLEKPFKYHLIDIGDFIKHSPTYDGADFLIKPITADGTPFSNEWRLLDHRIATESILDIADNYLESNEEIKFKTDIYALETVLDILINEAIAGKFDFYSLNVEVVKWFVEYFIKDIYMHKTSLTLEDIKEAILTELASAAHPNELLVLENNVLLSDIALTKEEINIHLKNVIKDYIIETIIVEETMREIVDKKATPTEIYFEFLFSSERYNIIAEILVLFTEDVILTSMVDLSVLMDIKESKGDDFYIEYEKAVVRLMQEFMPFHAILDKLILTYYIGETSDSSYGKEISVLAKEYSLTDINQFFKEKAKIYFRDGMSSETKVVIPSNGLYFDGGLDEIPYNLDPYVKPYGFNLYETTYGLSFDKTYYNVFSESGLTEMYSSDQELTIKTFSSVSAKNLVVGQEVYFENFIEKIFVNDNNIVAILTDSTELIFGFEDSAEIIVTLRKYPEKIDTDTDYFSNGDKIIDIKLLGINELLELYPENYFGAGLDDDIIVLDESLFANADPTYLHDPIYYVSNVFGNIPKNEMENVTNTSLTDYFKVKTTAIYGDQKIYSRFNDYIPSVDVFDNHFSNISAEVLEDFLIKLDISYKINLLKRNEFDDVYSIDTLGFGEIPDPEDMMALVEMREKYFETISENYKDVLRVNIMETDFVYAEIVYKHTDVLGHTMFGIDEQPIDKPDYLLDESSSVIITDEISVMDYEYIFPNLDIGNVFVTDMAYETIINDFSDYFGVGDINVTDEMYYDVHLALKRNPLIRYDALSENCIYSGPNGDVILENSACLEEFTKYVMFVQVSENLTNIDVDLTFRRLVPKEGFSEEYYRINESGSEVTQQYLRDKMLSDINTFYKDIIRVSVLDYSHILTRFDTIRNESYLNSLSDEIFSAKLVSGSLNYDAALSFKDLMVAIDPFATSNADFELFANALNYERDKLYKLEISDRIYFGSTSKIPIDRAAVKLSQEFLSKIVIDDPDFVDFRLFYRVRTKINEVINLTMESNNGTEISTIGLTDDIMYGDRVELYEHSKDILGTIITDRLVSLYQSVYGIDRTILTILDKNILAVENINMDTVLPNIKDSLMYGIANPPILETQLIGISDKLLPVEIISHSYDKFGIISSEKPTLLDLGGTSDIVNQDKIDLFTYERLKYGPIFDTEYVVTELTDTYPNTEVSPLDSTMLDINSVKISDRLVSFTDTDTFIYTFKDSILFEINDAVEVFDGNVQDISNFGKVKLTDRLFIDGIAVYDRLYDSVIDREHNRTNIDDTINIVIKTADRTDLIGSKIADDLKLITIGYEELLKTQINHALDYRHYDYPDADIKDLSIFGKESMKISSSNFGLIDLETALSDMSYGEVLLDEQGNILKSLVDYSQFVGTQKIEISAEKFLDSENIIHADIRFNIYEQLDVKYLVNLDILNTINVEETINLMNLDINNINVDVFGEQTNPNATRTSVIDSASSNIRIFVKDRASSVISDTLTEHFIS